MWTSCRQPPPPPLLDGDLAESGVDPGASLEVRLDPGQPAVSVRPPLEGVRGGDELPVWTGVPRLPAAGGQLPDSAEASLPWHQAARPRRRRGGAGSTVL